MLRQEPRKALGQEGLPRDSSEPWGHSTSLRVRGTCWLCGVNRVYMWQEGGGGAACAKAQGQSSVGALVQGEVVIRAQSTTGGGKSHEGLGASGGPCLSPHASF
jgi:hypothetical protein